VPVAAYTPRDPSASALYAVVRDHVETFRADAARLREGEGLPRFVDDEFRAFLRCGFLAGGFARFRCGECRTERLVAFSCKGRGFCPRCGGRRMAERAAHLVDRVLRDVPVRQWVLTLPHRIRYLLAWRHGARRIHGAQGSGVASEPQTCHARWEDFDLHAGVRVQAGHRDRLERVCRYMLRPPLADERLTVTGTGDVAVQLRRPWADGTTHLVLAPAAFLARLAVLVPRPRVNLLLYQGVLAPRAVWRSEVVPQPALAAARPPHRAGEETVARGARGWRWADLMRRVFAVDVLACPRCGGRLRFVATLETSEVTRRILQHLGLATEVPPPVPSRAPPTVDDWAA
jgi:hypothetical protein